MIENADGDGLPLSALGISYRAEVFRQDEYQVAAAIGQSVQLLSLASGGDAQGFDVLCPVNEAGGRFVLGQVNDAEVHFTQLAEVEQAKNNHDDHGEKEGPEEGGPVAEPHPNGHPGKVDGGVGQQARTRAESVRSGLRKRLPG